MTSKIFVALGTTVVLIMLLGVGAAREAKGHDARIELVSVRDHIEGSFTRNQAIYADQDRIYLGSAQGTLFVLARDRSANFPLLEAINTSVPLAGVRGDRRNLYVVDESGFLRVYRKKHPLEQVKTVVLPTFPFGGADSIAVRDGKLYISTAGNLAVDEGHVYMSVAGVDAFVLEFEKDTLTPGITYRSTRDDLGTVVVFDRASGTREASIAKVGNNLYVDRKILVQTDAGCCGPSIFIYDPATFELDQFIPQRFTNTVERRGRWLIAGNESGQVDVFDLRQNPSPLVSSADLRQLTGHTGLEDIEIRALWTDGHDNLIFAGSSWGNDLTRGPSLPSFFVLELLH